VAYIWILNGNGATYRGICLSFAETSINITAKSGVKEGIFMKKPGNFAILACLMALCLAFIACADAVNKPPDGPDGVTNIAVYSVTLNKTSFTLAVGGTETLVATVVPSSATNKNVNWSSGNPTVAAVNNGTVTAIAAGSASITVTTQDGGKIATCAVTVKAADSSIQTPVAGDYTIGNLAQTAGNVTAVTIMAQAGKSPGVVSNILYSGSAAIPQTVGSYPVTFDVAAATGWNAASGLSAGTLTVNTKAAPAILSWPTAAAITYGAALSSSALTGGVASVSGSFAWTSPSTIPTVTNSGYQVTFTPNDTVTYNTTTSNVSITVNKATPTVTTWPTAAAITYGAALSTSALTGGSASVAGSFAWTTGGTVPIVTNSGYQVTFTATDADNYNTVTNTVSIIVSKANPTITTWPTAAEITDGAALSTSALTGGVASVDGSFAWTSPLTIPTITNNGYQVTFTPNDTANYNTATNTVPITVNNKVTPTVTTWPTAAAITYGAALSTSGLSGGVANVAGSFAWTSGATIPIVANDGYQVTFTPTDTANYNTTTITVSITVHKATPTITTWPTAAAITYGAALSTSGLSGGVASVAGSFAWANGATIPNVTNSGYQVTFTPNDAANYNTTTSNVSITVNKATPTITTWPTAAAITYGAALSTSGLTGGEVSVAGSFAWTNGATIPTVTNSGYPVTFTPTDTANYNPVTSTSNISITVHKATGATVNAAPTVNGTPTLNSITINAVTTTTNTGQTVEYAKNTVNTAPLTGWQDGTSFTGLIAGTTYYFFARSKESANYNAGAVSGGTAIATKQEAGITLDVKQITEGAPVIAVITISRTGSNSIPVTFPVTVSNASEYTSITWEITGAGVTYAGPAVTGTGATFTLNAAGTSYNSLGGHVLLLTVTKGGMQYQRAIPFTIVQ